MNGVNPQPVDDDPDAPVDLERRIGELAGQVHLLRNLLEEVPRSG